MILGISNYKKFKTQEGARVGLPGEQIAKLTKLGWFSFTGESKRNNNYIN